MPRIRTHPGEILNEEFMIPLGLSARQLAKQIDVPPNRITEIIRARRDVSADTAIRLGRRFGTTPQFWLNLRTRTILRRPRPRTTIRRSRNTPDAFSRLPRCGDWVPGSDLRSAPE